MDFLEDISLDDYVEENDEIGDKNDDDDDDIILLEEVLDYEDNFENVDLEVYDDVEIIILE